MQPKVKQVHDTVYVHIICDTVTDLFTDTQNSNHLTQEATPQKTPNFQLNDTDMLSHIHSLYDGGRGGGGRGNCLRQ